MTRRIRARSHTHYAEETETICPTRSLAALFAVAATAATAQTTHAVTVGASGLTFTPNQITAAVGDIVSFEFHPKNHTLTQSTFASPCTAMASGVNSGFMPVNATSTTFPVYSFKVNEVTPLWFYCAQPGHCSQGMVFAINVNASSPNSFNAFLTNAKGGSAAATPGSSTSAPAASGMTTSAVSGATASAAPGAGSSTSTPPAGSGARSTTIASAGVLVSLLAIALGASVLA